MLQYHVEGFRQAGAELVAIADMNFAAAQAASEKWGVSGAYDSPEAMLAAHSNLDAVSIIVPNKFHAPLSIQMLEAGKHVFCEKPPALSAAEMETMIAVAEKSGKRLMFNFNNRARPESAMLKKYLTDGSVGGINSAQAKWIRRAGIPGFGGWFTSKELSGGGPLIDLLHMIDLALYFMDFPEPSSVLASTYNDFINDKRFKGPWGLPDREGAVNDVEAAAHGFITFKSGQCLSIQASWAEMIRREEVSVVFQGKEAGGKIERLFGIDGLDDTAIDSCELYTQEHGNSVNRDIITPACEDMGRSGSAANFIHTIEGSAEPLNTPDQALKLMRIVEAVYKSAESGKAVEL